MDLEEDFEALEGGDDGAGDGACDSAGDEGGEDGICEGVADCVDVEGGWGWGGCGGFGCGWGGLVGLLGVCLWIRGSRKGCGGMSQGGECLHFGYLLTGSSAKLV